MATTLVTTEVFRWLLRLLLDLASVKSWQIESTDDCRPLQKRHNGSCLLCASEAAFLVLCFCFFLYFSLLVFKAERDFPRRTAVDDFVMRCEQSNFCGRFSVAVGLLESCAPDLRHWQCAPITKENSQNANWWANELSKNDVGRRLTEWRKDLVETQLLKRCVWITTASHCDVWRWLREGVCLAVEEVCRKFCLETSNRQEIWIERGSCLFCPVGLSHMTIETM